MENQPWILRGGGSPGRIPADTFALWSSRFHNTCVTAEKLQMARSTRHEAVAGFDYLSGEGVRGNSFEGLRKTGSVAAGL
jgi:hypothetical protein